MELSQKDIRFLSFGYFLENNSPVELKFTQSDYYADIDYTEALKVAEELWSSTFATKYAATNHMDQVVPISGGIDSRALLMELLKYKAGKDINTFTFGAPGSLDYDIGNEVARYYGTNHCQLPINQSILSLDNANQFGRLVDYSCNLFLTPEISNLQKYQGMNIWSGTVIDVYFGRHFHDREATSFYMAAENFIRENTLSRHFGQMIDKDSLIEVLEIPQLPGCSLEHTIDLANRQAKFVAKHLLYEGFNFSTMLGPEIMEFALSIDQTYHSKQKLYIQMIQNMYTDFNKFPCKTSYGLKLSAPNYQIALKRLSTKILRRLNYNFRDPYVNYLNWENECTTAVAMNMSNAIGLDRLSDLTVELIKKNEINGGYAMDILNLLSLRIIYHEKK